MGTNFVVGLASQRAADLHCRPYSKIYTFEGLSVRSKLDSSDGATHERVGLVLMMETSQPWESLHSLPHRQMQVIHIISQATT